MVNMLEDGLTPILPAARLAELDYRIAAYPLTLLVSAAQAMWEALTELAAGRTPQRRVDFPALRNLVGFPDYDRLLATYEQTTGEGPAGQPR